jgi:beta-galactosidase
MNIECDFVWPESDNLDQYKAIFVPALYAAPDELLEKLKQYTTNGGHWWQHLRPHLQMRMLK